MTGAHVFHLARDVLRWFLRNKNGRKSFLKLSLTVPCQALFRETKWKLEKQNESSQKRHDRAVLTFYACTGANHARYFIGSRSHHITPHRVTLRHTTSRHMTSRHMTSHNMTSHHTSRHITSYIGSHHIKSRHITHHAPRCIIHHITPHHITSHYLTSRRATQHHITTHHIHITSHHVMSCHVMSCHIILYIITCRPPPKITWKKNGQEIINGWNSFEIPDAFYGRLLKIINVKRDLHQDVYTCEAENSQNSGNPLVYTINLNVEGKLRCYSVSLFGWSNKSGQWIHTYIHSFFIW